VGRPPQEEVEPLSIVSVVYNDPYFWQQNVALTRELNPGDPFQWIVVDNSDAPVLHDPIAPNVRFARGSPRPETRDLGSLHHALGLEKGLRAADGRFVALVDHDFYVVRPGWIAAVLDHMVRHRLALFGSVWHPRWFYQYRGFPSVHFMVIDTARLHRDQLDLRPRIDGDRWWHIINDERVRLPRFLRDTLKSQRIRDTGWMLYRRFHGRPDVLQETLSPHFVRPRGGRARWERQLSKLLPKSWLVYPAVDDGHTDQSVLEVYLPGAYQRGWEEHFWRDELFAVHLRRVGRAMSGDDTADDRALLEKFL
jgi:hypothetical protein